MTPLILRPDPRIPARRWVHTLNADGAEVRLGYVQYTDPGWRTHADGRARTREEAVRNLAEGAGLVGPFHVEELAARVRVRRAVQCPRGRMRGTVVTVRLVARV